MGITGMSTANMKTALTIAVRYSAVRRQFGPVEGGEEIPVLEYQLQVGTCKAKLEVYNKSFTYID